MLLKEDKYLSIIIVLFLLLIAKTSSTGMISMLFNLIAYVFALKLIVKLASIVQNMIYDVRKLLKL